METAAPPTRRRLTPAARRAEIVEAASELIAERGYNGFTLSDLAANARITRAGLSHYFVSREDVFIAVLETRDDADVAFLVTEFGASGPDDDVKTIDEFLAILDANVRRNASQRHIVRLYTVLSAEALAEDHPAHRYFQQRLANGIAGVAHLARLWHPEPEALSREIHAYLDGIQLMWLRQPELDLVALWERYAEKLRATHTRSTPRSSPS